MSRFVIFLFLFYVMVCFLEFDKLDDKCKIHPNHSVFWFFWIATWLNIDFKIWDEFWRSLAEICHQKELIDQNSNCICFCLYLSISFIQVNYSENSHSSKIIFSNHLDFWLVDSYVYLLLVVMSNLVRIAIKIGCVLILEINLYLQCCLLYHLFFIYLCQQHYHHSEINYQFDFNQILIPNFESNQFIFIKFRFKLFFKYYSNFKQELSNNFL